MNTEIPASKNRIGTWLYEVLERKVEKGIPLEELFLILPALKNKHTGAPEEAELEIPLEPKSAWPGFKGGTLKTFMSAQCARPVVCWTRHFNYPRISTTKIPRKFVN